MADDGGAPGDRLQMRPAHRENVPEIVRMLSEDRFGKLHETADLGPYYAAFDRMADESGNRAYVGEIDGRIVCTYQLVILPGLSLKAARRGQIESVRVDRAMRGQGLGRAIMADAKARARHDGCTLLQLTTNALRADAQRFYVSLGFTASHAGFKKPLQ